MFFAAIGADELQIEASFREAINTAKRQKSISLAKRAEASYGRMPPPKTRALDGQGSEELLTAIQSFKDKDGALNKTAGSDF